MQTYPNLPQLAKICVFKLRIVTQNIRNKDDGIIRPSNFTFTYLQDILVIATETTPHCCDGNALVIFKRRCTYLLFSTTKSLFDF